MTLYIGVDYGKDGAIAVVDDDGTVQVRHADSYYMGAAAGTLDARHVASTVAAMVGDNIVGMCVIEALLVGRSDAGRTVGDEGVARVARAAADRATIVAALRLAGHPVLSTRPVDIDVAAGLHRVTSGRAGRKREISAHIGRLLERDTIRYQGHPRGPRAGLTQGMADALLAALAARHIAGKMVSA